MTIDVVDDISPRKNYVASAGQTEFGAPFVVYDAADIKVYKNNVLLVLATDYTVAGVGTDGGVTVTLVTPAALNDAIVLLRSTVVARITEFANPGPFSPQQLNDELNHVTLIQQEMVDKLDRQIHLSDSDSRTNADLEIPLDSANKYLGFDSNNKLIALAGNGTTGPKGDKGDQGDPGVAGDETILTVYKATGTTRTSTVSLTADGDLFLNLDAGTWLFECFLPILRVVNPDTSGFQCELRLTGATSQIYAIHSEQYANGVGSILGRLASTDIPVVAGKDFVRFSGLVHSATGFAMLLYWAGHYSSADGITLQAGAFLQARRID